MPRVLAGLHRARVAGLIYIGYALGEDLSVAKTVPGFLLAIELLIGLGFEFVNGFHDAPVDEAVFMLVTFPRDAVMGSAELWW